MGGGWTAAPPSRGEHGRIEGGGGCGEARGGWGGACDAARRDDRGVHGTGAARRGRRGRGGGARPPPPRPGQRPAAASAGAALPTGAGTPPLCRGLVGAPTPRPTHPRRGPAPTAARAQRRRRPFAALFLAPRAQPRRGGRGGGWHPAPPPVSNVWASAANQWRRSGGVGWRETGTAVGSPSAVVWYLELFADARAVATGARARLPLRRASKACLAGGSDASADASTRGRVGRRGSRRRAAAPPPAAAASGRWRRRRAEAAARPGVAAARGAADRRSGGVGAAPVPLLSSTSRGAARALAHPPRDRWGSRDRPPPKRISGLYIRRNEARGGGQTRTPLVEASVRLVRGSGAGE